MTLVIQALTHEWVDQTAFLLSDTFADSMGYFSVYKRFLKRQIHKYLVHHMHLPPKTIILVAALAETPMSDSDTINESLILATDCHIQTPSTSPSGTASTIPTIDAEISMTRTTNARINRTNARVIGAVEISFTESTRSKYFTLNPPPDRPYLCNMAIDKNHRRQGYGSLLLEAAEELVHAVGEDSVYLHVRFQDHPAVGMYTKAEYTPVKEDMFWVKLFGQDQRYLMRKRIERNYHA